MRLLGGVLALAVCLCAGTAAADTVHHPFGSRPMPYASGTIRPSHVDQATQDQAVRDFYDAWKARYLRQVCGTGRWVVLTHVNPGNLTVSEGHGYGMLLMALMAGHEPDAQRIFDGMVTYFRQHPTATHANLMSWNQNRSCVDAQGNDSASDGDLDVAYALLLADKQWGSCGPIDYRALALDVLADIRDGELDASKRYVLLGDWADPGAATTYDATRSSDFMPDHLRSFASATLDTTWTDVLDQTYQTFDAIQTSRSPATGLLPDFIASPLGSPHPVAPNFLEGPNDGAYGYNACRDPWRLGTDVVVAGEARAKTAVQRINAWIRAKTGDDPARIDSGYALDGSTSPGADYRSMAFVAPLAVGAMVDAAHQTWLNALWDLIVGTPIQAEGYYENTLKLLGMIVMSGNWWAPEAVSGGCSASGTPLCTNGGYIYGGRIRLGGLVAAPGRQTLLLTGKMFFPQGTPAAPPFSDGAQILVEDVGSGASAVFDVTNATTAVPPASAGGCGANDGWLVRPKTTAYRNLSTALDPPLCTAGTSRGLYALRYRPHSGFDLDFTAKAQRATIAAPVGPLRATLVLGNTQAAGDAGACAVSPELACTSSATGSLLRCR